MAKPLAPAKGACFNKIEKTMVEDRILQLDPDETIILTASRSFFGLLPHITVEILAFLGLLAAIYAIARYQEGLIGGLSTGMAILLATAAALVVEIVVYLLIRTYLRNLLVLTNESIVQHVQVTPFAGTTSQLSLANIEDVTVKQNGFLAQLLDFGTLVVQTAGEKPNFVFTFAKSPKPAAAAIIQAKENFQPKSQI